MKISIEPTMTAVATFEKPDETTWGNIQHEQSKPVKSNKNKNDKKKSGIIPYSEDTSIARVSLPPPIHSALHYQLAAGSNRQIRHRTHQMRSSVRRNYSVGVDGLEVVDCFAVVGPAAPGHCRKVLARRLACSQPVHAGHASSKELADQKSVLQQEMCRSYLDCRNLYADGKVFPELNLRAALRLSCRIRPLVELQALVVAVVGALQWKTDRLDGSPSGLAVLAGQKSD